jgi:hypothetical protein
MEQLPECVVAGHAEVVGKKFPDRPVSVHVRVPVLSQYPSSGVVRWWDLYGATSSSSATPTNVAETNAASNVATNANAILACLGQVLECVYVLDDDVALLQLYRPSLLDLGERTGDSHSLAAHHRG